MFHQLNLHYLALDTNGLQVVTPTLGAFRVRMIESMLHRCFISF